ncbi:MAG: sulfatase-like hydrolase/transferase [Candidatus Hydrogenedentes bacterium]|nr:sulfatase-like hydrolase/transferase [Candidatus Hydrogenedentota bacterium]
MVFADLGRMSSEDSAAPPFNLLFILTDQFRHDAMSCAGSRFVDTPNLDRLAREGTRFERAITPSPICAPARVSILTGHYIHRHGCTTNPAAPANRIRPGVTSFDQKLHKAGYATRYCGRWHAPPALLDAYDPAPIMDDSEYYRAYLARVLPPAPKPRPGQFINPYSGWPYDPDPMDYAYRTEQRPHEPPVPMPGKLYGRDSVPAAHTISAMTADETIVALNDLHNVPFSITCSLLHPHPPLYIARPYCDEVKAADLGISETFDDSREDSIYRDFDRALDQVERAHIRLIMARYYAAVKEVDHHVGRILAAIDRLQLRDRTLVIFTADHGEMLGDHGLGQKFVFYDGSVRVPLILRLPGRIPRGVIVEPVNLIDLYATISDYLGIQFPSRDGRSLREQIQENKSSPGDFIVSQFEERHIMIQDREWKYVWSIHPNDVDMLFHLEPDPNELNNLLGRSPRRAKYLQPARRWNQKLLEWMEQTSHPWKDRVSRTEIR